MASNQPHTKRDAGGDKTDKGDKSKDKSPAGTKQKAPATPSGKPPKL